jgi:hypothetical protein
VIAVPDVPTLVAVPTVAELVANPSLARGLPRDVLVNFIAQLAATQAVLMAELSSPTSHPVPAPAAVLEMGSDRWLKAEAVEAQFSLSPRWLEDHDALLRQRHIVTRPSRRVILYSATRLQRFLETKGT